MEDAVDDDATELLVVGLAELLGVAAHRVYGDDDVAVDGVALGIVEGDDVGVVVVVEVGAVDFQNPLVGDKHVADVAHALAVGGSHAPNPCGDGSFVEGWHSDAVAVVGNHGGVGIMGDICSRLDRKTAVRERVSRRCAPSAGRQTAGGSQCHRAGG